MGIKNGYYSNDDIIKQNSQYNILIGGRDLGKSYTTKLTVLKSAYENKKPCIAYLRRWGDDIKTNLVESYFSDMNIKKITKNEYTMVTAYQGKLFFSNIEDGKVKRGLHIGHYFALNNSERYKSTMYPYLTDIIYEEFITDKFYLKDEPKTLQHFVSTLARDNMVRVWLIGNTISRVCPYYTEWSLDNIPRMEKGQIDIYNFDDVKIAVEYCPDRNELKNNMFFGNAVKSIIKGHWECDEYRHLPKKLDEYEILYHMVLMTKQFGFNIKLLIDSDAKKVVYIYPYTKRQKRDIHILGLENEDFYINPRIRSECDIADIINNGFPCFSDNLTGQDFFNSLKNIGKNPFR